MKTIVVLSDTHRNLAPLSKIERVLDECDYIVHLGDMAADARFLRSRYPEKTYAVTGNNDFVSPDPDELVLDVEGCRIFACHGHRYGVKHGYARVIEEGKKRLCNIVLFGHTHEALAREVSGVLLINPGCLTKFSPRQSYCYLVIHGQKATATVVDIPAYQTS